MPKRPGEDYPSSHADPPAQLTPLALLVAMMHERYAAQDYPAAINLAKIAAPYLHPRAPAANPATDLADMHDADLEQLSPRD